MKSQFKLRGVTTDCILQVYSNMSVPCEGCIHTYRNELMANTVVVCHFVFMRDSICRVKIARDLCGLLCFRMFICFMQQPTSNRRNFPIYPMLFEWNGQQLYKTLWRKEMSEVEHFDPPFLPSSTSLVRLSTLHPQTCERSCSNFNTCQRSSHNFTQLHLNRYLVYIYRDEPHMPKCKRMQQTPRTT